jgi:hypothetical protein
MSNLEVRVSFHLQSRAAGGGEVDLSGTQRVVAVPLGDADTPGGIVSWVNPAGVDIVIARLLALVTATPTAPGLTVDLTAGAEAIITANGFMASSASPRYLYEFEQAVIILAAGETLKINTTPESSGAAGLAGFLYIFWNPARIKERFERICGVAFEPTDEAIVLDGGTSVLFLPPRIIEIGAVESRSGTDWADLGTLETDFVYDALAGILTYDGSRFPRGSRNMRVTLTHGYDAVPRPIKRAALLVLVDELVPSNIDRRAISQANEFGQFQYAVAGGRLGGQRNWTGIPEVNQILEEYRITTVGVG